MVNHPRVKRPVGRPTIIGGRRVNVYLDDESLDVALALGDGNISAGVRLALKTYHVIRRSIYGQSRD